MFSTYYVSPSSPSVAAAAATASPHGSLRQPTSTQGGSCSHLLVGGCGTGNGGGQPYLLSPFSSGSAISPPHPSVVVVNHPPNVVAPPCHPYQGHPPPSCSAPQVAMYGSTMTAPSSLPYAHPGQQHHLMQVQVQQQPSPSGWAWGQHPSASVRQQPNEGAGAFAGAAAPFYYMASDASTPAFLVTQSPDGVKTATPVCVVPVPGPGPGPGPAAPGAAGPAPPTTPGYYITAPPSTPVRRLGMTPMGQQLPPLPPLVSPTVDHGAFGAATAAGKAVPASLSSPMDLLANVATAVVHVSTGGSSKSSETSESPMESPVLKPRARTPPPLPPRDAKMPAAPRLVPPSPPPPAEEIGVIVGVGGGAVPILQSSSNPHCLEQDSPRRVSMEHSLLATATTAKTTTNAFSAGEDQGTIDGLHGEEDSYYGPERDREEEGGAAPPTVVEPTILDVVVTKQVKVSGHQQVGNELFQRIIHLNVMRYMSCGNDHEKNFVVRSVVDGLLKNGTRFLKRRSSHFVELSCKASCRHVKKSLVRAIGRMEKMRDEERKRVAKAAAAEASTTHVNATASSAAAAYGLWSGQQLKSPPRPRLENPVPFGECAQPSNQPRTMDQCGPHPLRPHPNDVVFGRGNNIANHPGNLLFRKFVLQERDTYGAAPRSDKTKIAETIVNKILELSPPGRFLAMGTDGRYRDVELHRVLEKTCQACRERKWSPASAGRSTSGPPQHMSSSAASAGGAMPPLPWW